MKLLRWKQIVDLDEPSSIYLSRLLLVKCRWFGIYVHLIRRADQARCEHDHPWPFLTVILRGGYEEEVQGKVYVRRPGYIGYRPRGFEHRITKLLHGTATTLVFRGFDYKAWGFRTNRGSTIPWEHYVSQPQAQRVAWCDDRLTAALKLPDGHSRAAVLAMLDDNSLVVTETGRLIAPAQSGQPRSADGQA